MIDSQKIVYVPGDLVSLHRNIHVNMHVYQQPVVRSSESGGPTHVRIVGEMNHLDLALVISVITVPRHESQSGAIEHTWLHVVTSRGTLGYLIETWMEKH